MRCFGLATSAFLWAPRDQGKPFCVYCIVWYREQLQLQWFPLRDRLCVHHLPYLMLTLWFFPSLCLQAARNCLVNDQGIVKVSDFGLSRSVCMHAHASLFLSQNIILLFISLISFLPFSFSSSFLPVFIFYHFCSIHLSSFKYLTKLFLCLLPVSFPYITRSSTPSHTHVYFPPSLSLSLLFFSGLTGNRRGSLDKNEWMGEKVEQHHIKCVSTSGMS